MPICDSATVDQNSQIANIHYQGVRVLVVAATANSITFTAPQRDPATGTSTTGTFTANWGDRQVMWPPCPSTLPSKATATNDGPPPRVGASGELFLAETFVSANHIVFTTPKWPKSLSGPRSYNAISIWPTKVILTGVVPGIEDPIEASVNLLDPDSARPGQTLQLGDNPVQLQLSQQYFSDVGLPFGAPQAATSPAPWPWSALSAAIAEIDGVARDPRERASAWAVVAACLEQFMIANQTQKLVTEEQRRDLRRLLPDHPALQ